MKQRYLFFFEDNSSFDTDVKVTFKEAAKALLHYCGFTGKIDEPTLFKAIEGFNNEEINEIVKLLNIFLWTPIEEIYIISERIYGDREESKNG